VLKKKILFALIIICIGGLFNSCATTSAVGDDEYNRNLSALQTRIVELETRNQELESRLSSLLADTKRYADAYQSAAASLGANLERADRTADSLEDRIDRLLSYNRQLEELIQQESTGKR
jgi:chromosome segregation ATPase